MKKLCALLHIIFFSQQNDTKIIHFDEGIKWFYDCFSEANECHFKNLPLLSQKSQLTYRKFPLFGFPG